MRRIPDTDRKLNIAFLTKDYPINTVDAGFTSILALAVEMKQKGHRVVMISNRGYKSIHEPLVDKKYESYKGIHIYRPYRLRWFNTSKMYLDPTIPFNRILAPALGVRYVQNKLNIRFDIIHSSSSAPILFLMSILAGLFARKARLIHTIRSESHHKFWNINSSKILNMASYVIVPLNSLKKKLIAQGCKGKKIQIIRSAVFSDSLRKKRSSDDLRKEFSIQKGEKVVLYYGKAGPGKGVDILIDAINHIPKTSKIRFLFFHPDGWPADLVKMVEKNRFRKKISFNVRKIHVPDFLALADVQVLPLKSVRGTEGNPLCLLEGMDAGTPIVTTDLPDLKEIVANEKHVLMAKPADSRSLAKAIMRLLNDDRLRKRISRNAAECAKQFNIKNISEQHLAIYDAAIRR